MPLEGIDTAVSSGDRPRSRELSRGSPASPGTTLHSSIRGIRRRSANRLSQDLHARKDFMATKLDKTLKRELDVNGEPYMLTISPEGLKLVPKGKRKGHEVSWTELLSGQARLAAALDASLDPVRD
jgi:hypothetical protein